MSRPAEQILSERRNAVTVARLQAELKATKAEMRRAKGLAMLANKDGIMNGLISRLSSKAGQRSFKNINPLNTIF